METTYTSQKYTSTTPIRLHTRLLADQQPVGRYICMSVSQTFSKVYSFGDWWHKFPYNEIGFIVYRKLRSFK